MTFVTHLKNNTEAVYGFDDIGNRTQTKASGDQNGWNLRTASYSANSLNQYTSRDVPGYINLLGLSFATNTVTVNGQTAYRKVEYFHKELSVDNSASPVYQSVTVSATGQSDVTGNILLPKAAETFSYDADGNLTSDGLWTNIWNAENRLVKTESLSAVPTAARMREEWTYLPDGRWIQRIVSTNDGSAYYPASTNRYVWDGHVLLAVLNEANAVQVSFMHGSDLSGTIQGAGGVGGLLAVNIAGNGVHFAAYDGNGNVVALVSAADGTETARYEYGPFAEPIRMTGPMAKANPIRFSTDYTDDVNGDVKYPYRDYLSGPGRWKSRDPLEEYAGFNVYEFSLNDPLSVLDLFGLGTWKVQVRDVSEYFENSVYATLHGDPTGFIVSYSPAPGECPRADMPDGTVVLYQTITPPSNAPDNVPHVDNTKRPHRAPSTGCPKPPAMTPKGPIPNSYVDSPTWSDNPTLVGGVFKITAVASCRSRCKQKVLSTYYFEWDNANRKVIPSNPNDRRQYNDSMRTWYGY